MNGPAIWLAYSETHEQNEKGWSLRTKYVSCLSVSTKTKKNKAVYTALIAPSRPKKKKKEVEMTLMSFVVGTSQLHFFAVFFSQEFVF